jgi:cytochrome c554/c'-like protein
MESWRSKSNSVVPSFRPHPGNAFPARRVAYVICFFKVAVFIASCPFLVFAQKKLERPGSFSNFRPRSEVVGEKFIGSTACTKCHREKSQSYSHTAMANALTAAVQSKILQSHPRMTFRIGTYSYEIVNDSGEYLYRVTDGKETVSEPLLYAFGNAHVAQTYIFRHNGKLFESRLSYYSAMDGLDWTVGDALQPPSNLEAALGRDISGDEARNCFSCHGTAAVVNTKLELANLVPGVTCEACHGPGEKHSVAKLLDAEVVSPIFNPKTLDPETLSQEFCGACHRGVDTVAMMPDLGGINNVRFQPYRLYNSRGHDPKDPHLACTACHDPHLDLNQQEAANDANCKVCHELNPAKRAARTSQNANTSRKESGSSSTGKKCPVGNDRCVSCHMLKVELPGAHFKFTDHRIRIARPGEPYPY